MDTITGVVLRSPVIIAGARTHHVVGALASLYEGFGAYVHARFRGDYRQVVEALGLTRDTASESYFRAMPVADPDDICPLTIELKPLEDGEFLLGCGWCNG